MINTFIKSLLADNVHEQYQEKLRPYAPLIGNWNFDWVGHEDDGSTWTVPGEWIFTWILEGRVIQDNWICPLRELRKTDKYPEGEYGTTIRVYDFKENNIKAFWFGPILSQFNVFKVTVENDEIVQDEIPFIDKGKISRWVFKDITDESFKWEAFVTNDKTKTWKMNQEVFAKRRK